MTDLRDEAVEWMAIGSAEIQLGKGCWPRMPEAERNIWRHQQRFGALPKLLALLDERGFAVVPKEPDKAMMAAADFARPMWDDPPTLGHEYWECMLAAAPSPLSPKDPAHD